MTGRVFAMLLKSVIPAPERGSIHHFKLIPVSIAYGPRIRSGVTNGNQMTDSISATNG